MLGVLLEYGACFGGELESSRAWLRVEPFFGGAGELVEFVGQSLETVHYVSCTRSLGSKTKRRREAKIAARTEGFRRDMGASVDIAIVRPKE
jgi:hypothetical protein